MEAQQTLLYGIIEDNLVLAPEAEAMAQARLWHAIKNAETWQDFIDFTSQETFDALMLEILEVLGHEALYTQYLMGEDLSSYITDLYLPLPDDAFSTDLLPGFEEGTYMPVFAQEMIAWLPEDLQEHLGQIDRHPIHEFIYRIEPDKAEIVVQTLAAAGFEVKLNQELMEQAHGLTD